VQISTCVFDICTYLLILKLLSFCSDPTNEATDKEGAVHDLEDEVIDAFCF
jgi:hypothetical protein